VDKEAGHRPNKRINRFLIWGGLILIVVVGVVLAFSMIPGLTPEEVAKRWADDNVDYAGEKTAEVILDSLGQDGLDALILKELGGEWIEDRIHEHLMWSFSPATVADGGGYVVVATARVDFEVIGPPFNGRIEAAVPFELLIEGNDVVDEELVLTQASVNANLSDISIELNAEEATDKVRDLFKR
jgi:hypothetical protein